MAATVWVLVVDDEDAIRSFVAGALRDEGYMVREAWNGVVAFARLREGMPCAILLDMRMPVMDGWTFARAVRSLPPPLPPLICMTATTDAARVGAEIGATAVLGKPFDLTELLDTVGRFCCPAPQAV